MNDDRDLEAFGASVRAEASAHGGDLDELLQRRASRQRRVRVVGLAAVVAVVLGLGVALSHTRGGDVEINSAGPGSIGTTLVNPGTTAPPGTLNTTTLPVLCRDGVVTTTRLLPSSVPGVSTTAGPSSTQLSPSTDGPLSTTNAGPPPTNIPRPTLSTTAPSGVSPSSAVPTSMVPTSLVRVCPTSTFPATVTSGVPVTSGPTHTPTTAVVPVPTSGVPVTTGPVISVTTVASP